MAEEGCVGAFPFASTLEFRLFGYLVQVEDGAVEDKVRGRELGR